MEIEVWRPARPDHYTLGRVSPITMAVIHATAGRDSLAWLRSTSNPPVSCHVLIPKDGTRLRIVNDWDTAWHCGRSTYIARGACKANPNSISLGLELENLNDGKDPYPAAQFDAAAFQIATWLFAYPHLRVYKHSDIDSAKSDPAGLDIARLCRRAHTYLSRMYIGGAATVSGGT